MPWERRFFKGDEVWIETDEEGEPVIEDGKVFMKYDDDPYAKIYKPYADKVGETGEEGKELWQVELEDRERELDRREEKLDTREKKLDRRAEALDEWEASLKEEGLVGEETKSRARDVGREGTEAPPSIQGMEPPEDDVVEFHTDGACSGNPGPAGFGVVYRHGDTYDEWSEYIGEGTNNIAELAAIQSALEAVEDRDQHVVVYTDSRYAIGVLTKGWNAKANTELIKEIRDLLDEFDNVEIKKVAGHAGHPLNERADDLATGSIEQA